MEMTTTDDERIDVPVGFDVPDGWTPADPMTAGAPGAAYLLLADGDWAGFTPNVTVGVTRRSDDVDIESVAAESVRRLKSVGLSVSILDNQPVGNARAPGVAQVLGLRAGDLRLLQPQVHLTIPLGDAPHDRLVVELACTCRPDQAARVVPDFQKLVASFHLRQGEQQ